MKRTVLFAAIAAAFVPGVVLADMNYTNLEVNYLDLDGDGGASGDGFEIGGSWELNDQFHLFGSWQDQSFDGGFDGETLEVGAGWNHAFSDTLDATRFEAERTADFEYKLPLPQFSPGLHLLRLEATAGPTIIRRDVRFAVR